MSDDTSFAPSQPAAATTDPAATPAAAQDGAASRRQRLLFGETPAPMKLGIFQELAAAHPEVPHTALRAALRLHTRSTRYLHALASGAARLDLEGNAAAAVAPEHLWQALVELARRRQRRSGQGQGAWLRRRAVQAWAHSGVAPGPWGDAIRSQGSLGEEADAALDAALRQAAGQAARDEALLRAFEAAGGSVEGFAASLGREPAAAAQQLDAARRRRAAAPRDFQK